MQNAILFGDTPENFYLNLEGFIKKAIHFEFKSIEKTEEDFILKPAVVNMLGVTYPTIDSHVKKGYYKKYEIGSRILFSRTEILNYITASGKSGKEHNLDQIISQ